LPGFAGIVTGRLPSAHCSRSERGREIGGVQVVQQHDQRPAAGGARKTAGCGIEQRKPGVLSVDRWDSRARECLATQLRHDHAHSLQSPPEGVVEVSLANALRIGSEDLHPGPERPYSARLPALPPEHQRAGLGGAGARLLGQPGLADSGLAAKRDERPPPVESTLKRCVEDLDLADAADKRRADHRPLPHGVGVIVRDLRMGPSWIGLLP
jgi:hypothetical protein